MINFETKLSGQFTLRRKDAATGKVIQEVGPFSNLITDLGLNRIGASDNPIVYCYVGTGTVPAAATDAAMSAFLVATFTRSSATHSPPTSPDWYSQVALTYTFAAGTISNNITEVGIGWNATGAGGLWSRELIVDSLGNPVAITILPTEILEVVYAVRQYHDVSDFTGSFVLNGITYNYTGRAAGLTSAAITFSSPVVALRMSGLRTGAVALGAVTSGLTGGSAVSPEPGQAPIPYVANSLTSAATSSFSLTQGNSTTGITAFLLTPVGGPSGFFFNNKQIVLDKPIPKTNLNTMSFTWAYSWSRYTPPGP